MHLTIASRSLFQKKLQNQNSIYCTYVSRILCSFFDDISQRTAVSFEALAQDPPAAGFIKRNNPAKNNRFIGEKIDMRNPFQDLK